MTRAELLEALAVERMTNPWWKTPAPEPERDDEMTCRRRLRLLVAEAGSMNQKEVG